jgi:hypothetical protein
MKDDGGSKDCGHAQRKRCRILMGKWPGKKEDDDGVAMGCLGNRCSVVRFRAYQ